MQAAFTNYARTAKAGEGLPVDEVPDPSLDLYRAAVGRLLQKLHRLAVGSPSLSTRCPAAMGPNRGARNREAIGEVLQGRHATGVGRHQTSSVHQRVRFEGVNLVAHEHSMGH